jgi:hypothetical protein
MQNFSPYLTMPYPPTMVRNILPHSGKKAYHKVQSSNLKVQSKEVSTF